MPIESWWDTNPATTPRQQLGMLSPELTREHSLSESISEKRSDLAASGIRGCRAVECLSLHFNLWTSRFDHRQDAGLDQVGQLGPGVHDGGRVREKGATQSFFSLRQRRGLVVHGGTGRFPPSGQELARMPGMAISGRACPCLGHRRAD